MLLALRRAHLLEPWAVNRKKKMALWSTLLFFSLSKRRSVSAGFNFETETGPKPNHAPLGRMLRRFLGELSQLVRHSKGSVWVCRYNETL